jgi:hypothetical protein
MIKILILSAVFAGLAMVPIQVYNTQVEPQLMQMKQTYGSFDAVAEDVAAGKDVSEASINNN